ncbi:MAG: hypothetical protein N3G21_07675 [Candidatus Hydrogenedentes bacterium]|nr:hypothetical protein [Candidatus Hydrogenedentota bacterium]
MYKFGATFALEAVPMVSAISEFPNLEFRWYSWSELIEEFFEGRLDTILSPPLIAVEFPDSIVIPGVGISTRGRVPSPVLYTKVALEEGRNLSITAKYGYWKSWLGVVMSNLGLNYERVRIVGEGKFSQDDTILAGVDDEDYSSARYKVVNLGELWKRMASETPMVCWVWVCRRGADYRQIRMLLGRLWDKAKENLSEASCGGRIYPELMGSSDVRAEDLADIYYNVASAEVESIRWILDQAKKFEFVSKEADFIMC